jgi:hypothetical protein
MNDFNNFNRPEPVVTVSRPLFTKHTPLYIMTLVCVTGGAFAYWQYINKAQVVPEVTEVVDAPLTEAETNEYRDTLPRVSADSTSASALENPVVVQDGVKEISPESVASLVAINTQTETFVVPNNATAIELNTVTTGSEGAVSTMEPQNAYLEGDVTLLDFQLDNQKTAGSAVELTGTIYANDTGLKRVVVVSNGSVYTVQTDNTKMQTQNGKIINQANLKNNDIVLVTGMLLEDSDVIIAQSVTLTGVQEYNFTI